MTDQATYLEIENCDARAMAIVLDELHAQGVGAEQVGDLVERRSLDHALTAAGVVGTVVAYKLVDKALDLAIDAAIDAVKKKWGIVVRRRFAPTGRHAADRVPADEADPVPELWRLDNEARKRAHGGDE
jgi:hypothetical protein